MKERAVSGDPAALDPPTDRSRPGILYTLGRHVPLFLVVFIFATAVGYGVSWLLPVQYTTVSAVFFRADGQFQPTDTSGGSDPERFVADQTELVVTSEVLQRAGAAVVPPVSVDDVRDSVSAAASSTTSRMSVTVVRPDPQQARVLADAVIESYRQSVRDRVAATEAAALSSVSDSAAQQDVRLRAAAYGDGIATVEPAALPTTASAPLRVQNALLTGLAALLAAAGFVVLRDRRLALRASVAELDMLLGAPLLARFPAPASRAIVDMVTTDTDSQSLRAAHDLLVALDVAFEQTRSPSVLFLSWQAPLSTTSLVVSAGVSASRSHRPTVVVDGGLKERGITAIADVDPGLGVQALANRDTPLSASLRRWQWEDGTELDTVPIDEWVPSPNGAVARPAVLESALARLRDMTSLILIDGPPLTERSLGLALGRAVDGVVLVVDEQTSVDDAHEMGRRTALAGVTVIGYVLVGRTTHLSPRRSWLPRTSGDGGLSLSSGSRLVGR